MPGSLAKKPLKKRSSRWGLCTKTGAPTPRIRSITLTTPPRLPVPSPVAKLKRGSWCAAAVSVWRSQRIKFPASGRRLPGMRKLPGCPGRTMTRTFLPSDSAQLRQRLLSRSFAHFLRPISKAAATAGASRRLLTLKSRSEARNQGRIPEQMSYNHERTLAESDPEIYAAIQNETRRQHEGLELIASENFVSEAVLEAAGSVFTNKYAEGYPGKRYYGGCEFTDVVESLAISRAKQLFNAEHVNVQPHSGSQANMAVYLTACNHGDTILGMDLSHGGHLTHGHPLNFSGRSFKVVAYGVKQDDETIDYDQMEELANQHKPKLIVCGASAYSRVIDFERIAAIASSVGAKVMADIAHIAGLVVTGLHPSPVPHCDFVTTTTHKTLRGPRAGLIMCKEPYAKDVDRNVFPCVQGGPLVHIIAAKAVSFKEALQPEFKAYQQQILKNAKALSATIAEAGFRIVSGGTDNHVFLVDVFSKGIFGKDAEKALDVAHITVNKNSIPFDTNPPLKASGIRVGTPAVTTRGMGEEQMRMIGTMVGRILQAPGDETARLGVISQVKEMTAQFPLYVNRLHNASGLGAD